MKKKVLTALITAFLVTSIGSSVPNVSAKEKNSKNLVICPIKYETNENYEIVQEEAIPKKFKGIIDACKYNKGYISYKDENMGEKYIAIIAGEKPNPAYGINVKSAENIDGKINIIVEEIVPSPDIITAQVISYPYSVIKLKDAKKDFIVKDDSGNIYRDSRLRGENNQLINHKENIINFEKVVIGGLWNIFRVIK